MLAVCIHGYHPYAEDGGIYLTGIKRLLDPHLYPYATGFVLAHTRFSLFAPVVAAVVRASSLRLMAVVLSLYVASIWLTLFAGWQIARRCFRDVAGSYGAVCFLAVSLTVPVAGTSLMLVDPYLSARSISTPCSLFAIIFALDAVEASKSYDPGRRWRCIGLCGLALLAAAIMHPLMAGYSAACMLLLPPIASDCSRNRVLGVGAICLVALLLCAGLYAYAPVELPGYTHVAQTRTYWFIGNWKWYEQFGLVAPVIILASFGQRRSSWLGGGVFLARMGAIAGFTGIVAAILFANTTSSSLMVARLQPLRIFHMVYLLAVLSIGGWLGEHFAKRNIALAVAVFGIVATIMFGVQRHIFHYSSHLELPWRTSTNSWEQAFIWVRDNTPPTAVFALDANFITTPGEDSQSFRAISERSSLPDYSKDGGVAAIEPDLTAPWLFGEATQHNLNSISDTARIIKLRPTGAGWVVLSQDAATSLQCDYTNRRVKVCRLPWTPAPGKRGQ